MNEKKCLASKACVADCTMSHGRKACASHYSLAQWTTSHDYLRFADGGIDGLMWQD